MRKSSLALIAVCVALLWAGAGYTQSDQPAEGCPFQPQRFPATGQTTSYVAGDDGDVRPGAPLRYRDNGDGTITDENTDLMWEKKDQASGGLHNWNNTYPWEGTCSNSSTTLCGTDADCSGHGACTGSGSEMTIFQWCPTQHPTLLRLPLRLADT